MNKEFDSNEELKHDAKLLHWKLRVVRDYRDPYAEFNDKPATPIANFMERWPEPVPYAELD